MLSILCVRLTIKVKVGIPESFKVGWYPPQKTGSSHLNREATLKTTKYYFRITGYSAKIRYSSSKSITVCFKGGVLFRFLTARRHFWTPWWERTYCMENRQSLFFSRSIGACEVRALPAHKTLSPHFTDFFTDFEKKNRLFCCLFYPQSYFLKKSQVTFWLWSNKTSRKR